MGVLAKIRFRAQVAKVMQVVAREDFLVRDDSLKMKAYISNCSWNDEEYIHVLDKLSAVPSRSAEQVIKEITCFGPSDRVYKYGFKILAKAASSSEAFTGPLGDDLLTAVRCNQQIGKYALEHVPFDRAGDSSYFEQKAFLIDDIHSSAVKSGRLSDIEQDEASEIAVSKLFEFNREVVSPLDLDLIYSKALSICAVNKVVVPDVLDRLFEVVHYESNPIRARYALAKISGLVADVPEALQMVVYRLMNSDHPDAMSFIPQVFVRVGFEDNIDSIMVSTVELLKQKGTPEAIAAVVELEKAMKGNIRALETVLDLCDEFRASAKGDAIQALKTPALAILQDALEPEGLVKKFADVPNALVPLEERVLKSGLIDDAARSHVQKMFKLAQEYVRADAAFVQAEKDRVSVGKAFLKSRSQVFPAPPEND